MLVALCQMNSVMGDPRGNGRRIESWYRRAASRGAELVVVPELAVPGYPPNDLLEEPAFVDACLAENRRLTGETGAVGLLFGSLVPNPASRGKTVFNAGLLAAEGRVVGEARKKLLPSYDVFDEDRYFEPDPGPARPVAFGGIRLGIHVCEDAWNEEGFWARRIYERDPVQELAAAGAQVLLNLSASPFHLRKSELRRSMFASHARRHGLPFLYANLVGGNDDLLFDGDAYVLDPSGALLASTEPFEEGMLLVEVDASGRCRPREEWPDGGGESRPARVHPPLEIAASARRALVMGIRDYAGKCGFRSAVLGLSGGIDSAVTAALAAEALGPGNVWGIALPGRYSSAASLTDARDLAANLGIRFEVVSIEGVFSAALESLDDLFAGTGEGIAEENLQARARGLLLMALSNKFGHLLLSTGNKSETAVGYTTLYGDMAGGLAAISDVPKTLVYAVARELNRGRTVIPESTLVKPPSAELKPDQKDQDSLPPYEVLDPILQGIVEEGRSAESLVADGFDPETVQRTLSMVARAEYKRRQAAPGLRITPKAFGFGRRMPITSPWQK